MNRILVILNPAANSTRAKALKKKVESLSKRAVVRLTSSPGDAEAFARDAVSGNFETVVAAGGDGTVNEVVNGIARSHCRLGILPVGTMNVFAAELGLPMNNLAAAWNVIETGHVRMIDLAKVTERENEHYFVQLSGAGLDAEVVRSTTTDTKNMLGPMSYLITLAQVAAKKAPRIRVETKDRQREGSFVLVGNGRYYGGPFVVFKDAKLDDGLLDVLIFQNQSHWDLVRYFQAIAFGTHLELKDVEYFQARSVKINCEDEVPFEVDGEVCGTLPIRIGFSRHKLRVLVPPPA